MKILVTGATGMIGQKLCVELLKRDHELVIVGRASEAIFRSKLTLPCQYLQWDELDLLDGIDVVFHLAGESIASGRWTQQRKKKIIDSRVETMRSLWKTFSKKGNWPKTVISASAIGIYGDRKNETLSEESSYGHGFVAQVCQAWEEISQPFAAYCRLVHLRIGLVLDSQAGFLSPMYKLFNNNLGGVVGSGEQWMSWIHIQDLLALFIFVMENESAKSPVNAVSPEPVTNKEWTITYARQLKSMATLPAPAIAIKLILGQMAELALSSQKVSSSKLLNLGFSFRFNHLSEALADLYSWRNSPSDHLFRAQVWLPIMQDKVFLFFSRSNNLKKITPPWLNLELVGPASTPLKKGSLIDYKLQLHGIRLKWQSKITLWQPPDKFADDQQRGPFEKWHHQHSFIPIASGTLVQDEVVYALPGGRLGGLMADKLVAQDIRKIFAYRQVALQKLAVNGGLIGLE